MSMTDIFDNQNIAMNIKKINEIRNKLIELGIHCYKVDNSHVLYLIKNQKVTSKFINEIANMKIKDLYYQVFELNNYKYGSVFEIILYDILCNILIDNKKHIIYTEQFADILKDKLNNECDIHTEESCATDKEQLKVKTVIYDVKDKLIWFCLIEEKYEFDKQDLNKQDKYLRCKYIVPAETKWIVPYRFYTDEAEEYAKNKIIKEYKNMKVKDFINMLYGNSIEAIKFHNDINEHLAELAMHKACILINAFLNDNPRNYFSYI